MEPTYTGYDAIRRDGQDHFAEVTIRASPGPAPSRVILSTEALDVLRSVFGADFEVQRHNVRAAVAAHIEPATRYTAKMPNVGAISFHAEVVRVRVSGNAGREISGFLLSVAGMNAILEYLRDWIDALDGHDDRGMSEEKSGQP